MIALVKKNLKNILLFGGLLVALFVGYNYFFAGENTAGPLIAIQQPAPPSGNSDLLAILLALRSLRLDDTVFSDETFKRLQDFGIEIPTEPLGRPNPFAPLPGGGVSGPVIKIGSVKK